MGRVQNKKVGRECGGEYTLKNFIAALKAKSQVRSSTHPPHLLQLQKLLGGGPDSEATLAL